MGPTDAYPFCELWDPKTDMFYGTQRPMFRGRILPLVPYVDFCLGAWRRVGRRSAHGCMLGTKHGPEHAWYCGVIRIAWDFSAFFAPFSVLPFFRFTFSVFFTSPLFRFVFLIAVDNLNVTHFRLESQHFFSPNFIFFSR